jgi:hypothetical protein
LLPPQFTAVPGRKLLLHTDDKLRHRFLIGGKSIDRQAQRTEFQYGVRQRRSGVKFMFGRCCTGFSLS